MPDPLPYFTPHNDKLVPVASFPSTFIAELAAATLNANEIPATVLGANAASLGASAAGMTGAEVYVRLSDVPAAREILSNALPAPEGTEPRAPWNCPACNEKVPANFDLCWNCGTSRSGNPDPTFSPAITFNPLCETCGYLLTGLPSNICPECGTEFDPQHKT